jgi:hypothetical protein
MRGPRYSAVEGSSRLQCTCLSTRIADKFDEVSLALNKSSMMPWATDGKHRLDRYKLLVASFKRADRIRASASGTEEDFGEKDKLLSDIICAVDDTNERGRTERL